MKDEAKLAAAKKRIEDLKGFYTHLMIYIIVNAILFIINFRYRSEGWWFLWTPLFWGIGLVWHFLGVFVFHGWVKRWEENKIKELMKEEK